jgi:hypothetical protein
MLSSLKELPGPNGYYIIMSMFHDDVWQVTLSAKKMPTYLYEFTGKPGSNGVTVSIYAKAYVFRIQL